MVIGGIEVQTKGQKEKRQDLRSRKSRKNRRDEKFFALTTTLKAG
jgi:hypothetical protein